MRFLAAGVADYAFSPGWSAEHGFRYKRNCGDMSPTRVTNNVIRRIYLERQAETEEGRCLAGRVRGER